MGEVPTTKYAKTEDGVHIAYQVFGDGPMDLVVVPGFISHLEQYWESPFVARLFRRLGSIARVITFDKRGTGLSDRTATLPDVDRRMLDVLAVMDDAGSDRAALLGISEGGSMAIVFAATHPERAQALALYGAYAKLTSGPDHPIGVTVEELEAMGEYVEARWGTGVGWTTWAPSLADDDEGRRWWARLQRLSASPGSARQLITSYSYIDARPALPLVQAPTLVVHRTDDRMIPVELGREIADAIEGARMVEFPGADHLLPASNGDLVVDEIAEFLTGAAPAREPDRVLATVLFTDIVESTSRVSQIGDRRWREVLDRHDRLVDGYVHRHGGRVVKNTGDGILAVFDGPTRAVRCAQALAEGSTGLGIEIRAGLHTGEIVERGDDVAGIAVHVAQRVSAAAGAGEVLVSRTLVDLVAGSDLGFVDRGERELKGVDGSWRLFSVVAG